MNNNPLPTLCDNKICTGCSACANICPVDAINMVNDSEGFLNPIIDEKKCIKCHKCENTCPVINKKTYKYHYNIETYACWNTDFKIRNKSASGGIFSALATTILNKGGYIVGATYNNNMNVEHIIINQTTDLHKLRGSKYVQSSIKYIFRDIKLLLEKGELVMFIGTPCQVAGLKSYIGNDKENLLCCDFICHGVPSQTLFKEYIKWLEENKKIKISTFNFRDKRKGWYDAMRIANDNIIIKGKYDIYFEWFNKNITLRESCYKCPFKGFYRYGDITIADYWGLGMLYKFKPINEIHKGISFLMINTTKGALTFEDSKGLMQYSKRPINEILYRNEPMVSSSERPKLRDLFYIDMNSHSFNDLRKKYKTRTLKSIFVYCFREYMPNIIVTYLRNITQIITWKKNGSKTV